MFVFDVPVEGEPPPKYTWKRDDEELKHGGRIKIENADYNTKFQLRNAERGDTGVYRLKAENENGKDEATVQVNVLDKPSAPEGPLEATDIFADHMTLHWKPPIDDGGLAVDHYNVEKFDPSLARWVPAGRTADSKPTELLVDGLTAGKEYKFRVKAVNAEGESEPLDSTQSFLAKNPFDAAGKPGRPEIADYDVDHVDLKWTPPTNDGGAKIESYIVEMKDKFSPWMKAVEVPADQLTATVAGLTKGEEYQFRVKAKNAAGPGEPSDESDKVTAKARHLAPKIDRSAIQEIKVRAGQGFDLNVPVSGEPPPTIVWTFGGKELQTTDRLKIDNPDYMTKFSMKRTLRSDTGAYLITATNDSGKDEAIVNVIVLDHPASPEGPLNVTDIHKEGCHLDWKPPVDDGGADISHYVVEKQDVATGLWTPAGECVDTDLQVKDLKPDHEYKFRVKAVNRYGESDPLTAQRSMVAKNPFDEPEKPGTPDIVDWDKDHADLEWTPPLSDGGAPIEKYCVEKKRKNGDWEFALEVPADQTKATVTGLIEGQEYQFRVKAMNKAGASHPSDPSRTMIAKARHLPPKIDRTTLIDMKIKAGQIIDFDVNVEGEPPPKIEWRLNGEQLGSSERTKIENKDYNTKLKTAVAARIDSGKYTIIATNESGKDEAEVEVIVLDAPSAPKGPLQISDIYKEGCTLHWRKPDDDGGSGISHYLIEKQEDDGRWVEAGQSPDTDFKVTKLNPGHEYKFRVKAVNKQGQSEPLTADHSIIAKNQFEEPGKPRDVQATDWDKDHVDLAWQPPESDGNAKITKYVIEKKDKFGEWTPAAEVPGDQTSGTVPGLIPYETYKFRVRAVNKAGQGQPSDETGPIITKPRRLAPKIAIGAMNDIKIRAGTPLILEVPFEAEPQPSVVFRRDDETLKNEDRHEIEIKDNFVGLRIFRSERGDSGQYSLTLRNEYGEDKGTCQVTVLDVPGDPEGPLKISDVHREGCTLDWKPPKDNGGTEISHYVVEKMDTGRGTWQEVGIFGTDCHAKIGKLNPNKEYKFRVKAVNLQGESKPLESDTMVAKNEFDEPDAPEKPEVVDWDRDRIDIKWQAPKNNGGSPITHYEIERKEKGSPNWVPCGKSAGTNFSATGLREGQEYEFRVIAVNAAGPSAPSEPTDPRKAKPRFLAPKILNAPRQVKIRAGLTTTIDVEYVGEPAPDVEWAPPSNMKQLPETFQIDNKENLTTRTTSLFIPAAKRNESGDYSLKLKNDSGSDETMIEIIVQDVPGAPEGPMDISDVTKDGCLLQWKPPKDDGGSEITNYVVEKRDVKSSLWTPVSNFVTGTSCLVGKLQEGHDYEFRVTAENQFGRSEPLVSEKPITAKDPYGEIFFYDWKVFRLKRPHNLAGVPNRPGQPECKQHDRDFIDIEWTRPSSDGGSPITHYDVERKDVKTGRWIKVNGQPVKGLKYHDDKVTEDHQYEYRVVAVNAAGPSKPSDASKVITAKPMFGELMKRLT
uniref:Twitchin n=1 Tax=Romanomermis culicivorax TaxID=13658 RepID=A0A915KJE1_ROMCU